MQETPAMITVMMSGVWNKKVLPQAFNREAQHTRKDNSNNIPPFFEKSNSHTTRPPQRAFRPRAGRGIISGRNDRMKLTSLDFFAGFNAKKLAVRIEK